jgi:hypothetical protein
VTRLCTECPARPECQHYQAGGLIAGSPCYDCETGLSMWAPIAPTAEGADQPAAQAGISPAAPSEEPARPAPATSGGDPPLSSRCIAVRDQPDAQDASSVLSALRECLEAVVRERDELVLDHAEDVEEIRRARVDLRALAEERDDWRRRAEAEPATMACLRASLTAAREGEVRMAADLAQAEADLQAARLARCEDGAAARELAEVKAVLDLTGEVGGPASSASAPVQVAWLVATVRGLRDALDEADDRITAADEVIRALVGGGA